MASNQRNRIFSNEMLDFIREIAPGMGSKEMTSKINARFNTNFTNYQIRCMKKNWKIRSGLTGHFPKGHYPKNAIKKGQHLSQQTEFKKGRLAHNKMPIGSEVVTTDGYIRVKVADPNAWRFKHQLLWEQAHGGERLDPRKQCLLFKDGNPLNVTLDNLMCISRAELLILNRQNMISSDPDITYASAILARLQVRTHKIIKRREQKAHAKEQTLRPNQSSVRAARTPK